MPLIPWQAACYWYTTQAKRTSIPLTADKYNQTFLRMEERWAWKSEKNVSAGVDYASRSYLTKKSNSVGHASRDLAPVGLFWMPPHKGCCEQRAGKQFSNISCSFSAATRTPSFKRGQASLIQVMFNSCRKQTEHRRKLHCPKAPSSRINSWTESRKFTEIPGAHRLFL